MNTNKGQVKSDAKPATNQGKFKIPKVTPTYTSTKVEKQTYVSGRGKGREGRRGRGHGKAPATPTVNTNTGGAQNKKANFQDKGSKQKS